MNRGFLAAGAMFTLVVAGCATPPETPQPLSKRINASIDRGVSYLNSRRDADGLWRSDVYGTFKDPSVLTPFVLNALEVAKPGANTDQRGLSFLVGMARPDDSINAGEQGLSYPIYTAAFSVGLLSKSHQSIHAKAQSAWMNELIARQLDEKLGWEPGDPEYGGWGYSKDLPRKPATGLQVLPGTESNLSATTFALEALREAGAREDVFRKAKQFLERCQNFSTADRASPLDDGGFFFIPSDPVRNKAGIAGKDGGGRTRYASYGSATADGIRALKACGVPESDPRLQAARRWLERSFRANSHPGGYAVDREVNREAVYYYYAFSVSRGLRNEGDGRRRREELAEALIDRQGADGSWVNSVVAVREDDPLVATTFAVLALRACR
jgi:hypothetical protein